jgi:hypothetical protein
MVIDFVEFLQLGLVVDGRRDVGDDLGFVGLARKQAAFLKSIKAANATVSLAFLNRQSFRKGYLHFGSHRERAVTS